MLGSIRSRQKCCKCGGPLIHDERRNGCFCKDHPEVAATSFVVWFPGDVYRRYKSYESACQALNFLRHERGTKKNFNAEDYKSTKPHAFINLVPKYLEEKSSMKSFKQIERHMNQAAEHFGDEILRDIKWPHIKEYVTSIPDIGLKTKANILSRLHDFWMWALEEEKITQNEMPVFKKIEYVLGYRKITTWQIQRQVLDKIKEMTYHFNPKVWLAIDMLATYTEIRPDDIRRIREEDFDGCYVTIMNPTKKKNKMKMFRLCKDHIDEWKTLQKRYPCLNEEVPFFRHECTMSNRKAGTQFGINYLSRVWDAACKEVGLEGVSLYAGTKHTTATETTKLVGKKKAQEASGLTNKSFERYTQAVTDGAYEVVRKIRKAMKGDNVIPFKKKERLVAEMGAE